MRLKDFATENIGSAIGRAASDIGSAIDRLDLTSGATKAKQELAQDWNSHFAGKLKSDASARQRYGQTFKAWVSEIDPDIANRVQPTKVVADGKPDQTYMNKVLTLLYKSAMSNQKGKKDYQPPKDTARAPIKIGTVGVGSDGQEYVWRGGNWINNKNNKIKPMPVTVSST